ncbi:MAG: L-seryl-tRNA(Sec) selenium transferase [Campylobacterota bacterium]
MQELFRQLPKVDKLSHDARLEHIDTGLRNAIIANILQRYRDKIADKTIDTINKEHIIEAIINEYESLLTPSLQPLVNATGITVHTNLGRAPIDAQSFAAVQEIACGYCNLEYDLTHGKRGDRYWHLSRLSNYLFDGYDMLLVNNNAAAVFLVLNSFAKGAKTVVSRSELVEIGGGFRVPEVMQSSGTTLVEVGTTNKTRISDYADAIDSECAMLMKVHRSNFSIEGFFEEASVQETADLAKQKGIYSYYDLGSGMVEPLAVNKFEPTVNALCKSGVDIISFSSDKLMGSIQGGLILAKSSIIEKLKKNQLLRMLRADKITIALIYQTLQQYLFNKAEQNPTYKMLSKSQNQLQKDAQKLQGLCSEYVACEAVRTTTYAGGGSMPNTSFDSWGVRFFEDAKGFEAFLRKEGIIARIENEAVIMDVRTLFEKDYEYVAKIVKRYKGVKDNATI